MSKWILMLVMMFAFASADEEPKCVHQMLKSGDFSIVDDYDEMGKQYESSYSSSAFYKGYYEWKMMDLNGDEVDDLLWLDIPEESERMQRTVVMGIFICHPNLAECIHWDLNDNTEFIYLSENNNLIYTAWNYGVSNDEFFALKKVNENNELETVSCLSTYYVNSVEDITCQRDNWYELHPDHIIEEGCSYRWVTYDDEGNRVKEEVNVTQFKDYYMELTGEKYDNKSFLGKEKDISKVLEAEEYLKENLPELTQYGEYIQEKSDSKAELEIEGLTSKQIVFMYEGVQTWFYQILIKEKWEDHQIIWESFLVSEDFDTVLWYNWNAENDVEYMTLDEWRNSEIYRNVGMDDAVEQQEDKVFGEYWNIVEPSKEFYEIVLNNPIDTEFESNYYSTLTMIESAQQYLTLWEKEIDNTLKILEAELDKEDFESLMEAHYSWKVYIEKTHSFNQEMYYVGGIVGGSMTYVTANEVKANRVKEHAIELMAIEYSLTGKVTFAYESGQAK